MNLNSSSRSSMDQARRPPLTRPPSRTRRSSCWDRAANFCACGRSCMAAPFCPRADRSNGHPLQQAKVVVITFGGGRGDQETFAPKDRKTFRTSCANSSSVCLLHAGSESRNPCHYVATGQLATGVYETINNFASLPPNIRRL